MTQARIIDHPSIEQLRDSAAPDVRAHVASCALCASTLARLGAALPADLVAETAFRWPAQPMATGGMAAVYLADDKRLGRQVILKLPHTDDVAPGLARMFEQRVAAEARILAKLQHPAIVTIHELGRATTGVPFCVMERVNGESLRATLDRLPSNATRERLQLLPSLLLIAEAMAYAHERRVVHRDITPNNILLGSRGEATLIDWGIARDLDALGSSPQMTASMSGRWATLNAGTPPYVPLEQAQGMPANPCFDVYSFGMTLYEVVAGHTAIPWQHRDTPEDVASELDAFMRTLEAKRILPPASPRDPELSGIIANAIAPPAERFTADELVTALKQYLHGELVFSHRYSATGRLGRWVRAHKAITLGVVALCVAAVAGLLVWAQFSRAAQERAELQLGKMLAEETARARADEAAQAAARAEAAMTRARAAEAEGQSAESERLVAEAKRLAAEAEAAKAASQALAATGVATKANKERNVALADKEAARQAELAAIAAQQAAEQARIQAQADREAAELARTQAHSAQSQAEQERNQANEARQRAETERAAAEAERDAAREGQARAERERDLARTEKDQAVKAAAEKLTEAQRRIEELEARGARPR